MSVFLELYMSLTIFLQVAVVVLVVFDDFYFSLRPSWIYTITDMNKVGCWIVAIISWLICPIWAVCTFLYWLFHIGRKD